LFPHCPTASVQSFHAHRHAHTAADAQRGEALLRAAALHLVDQRVEDAGARSTDRVANGDRPAVDVDDVGVPAHVLVDRAGLRREGLVGLDEIEVADRPAGLLQRPARGRDRPRAHDRRIDAGGRPRGDAGNRRDAAPGGFRLGHQQRAGCAVVDAGSVAGGDGALLVEGGLQLLHGVDGGAVADVFVLIDHGVALAALHGEGDDLVLEPAGLLGGFRLVLRGERELVLVVTGDLELLGDVLGGVAHVVAVEGVPQPILDHRVDHLEVAHLDAGAQMLRMRRQRHRLLAAGHDDLRVSGGDLLHAKRDGAQARAADLVKPPGRRTLRQAGMDRRLAGRVLALGRSQHLAEDHLVDLAGLDAGPHQQFANDGGAQLMRGGRREGPVERTDRGARGAGDDDRIGCGHFVLR